MAGEARKIHKPQGSILTLRKQNGLLDDDTGIELMYCKLVQRIADRTFWISRPTTMNDQFEVDRCPVRLAKKDFHRGLLAFSV